MSDEIKGQRPFINSHAHIFTNFYVPKYLAKKILPWPFYTFLKTGPALRMINSYIDRKNDRYTDDDKNKRWRRYKTKKFFATTPGINYIYYAFLFVVWVIFGYYLWGLIEPLLKGSLVHKMIEGYIITWMDTFMPNLNGKWNTIGLLLFVLVAFRNIRNGLRKYLWSQVKKMLGKDTVEFLLRYVNIVLFSRRKWQANIFNALEQQYPPKSKFVVLPMDMEFMEAGPVEKNYDEQMEEILRLKSNNKSTAYPFIFVDPRRIRAQSKQDPFLSFNTSNPNKIELNECKVKTWLEGECAGIKIYPALGYYVFDKDLLTLWLYCVQNDIPVTTHCSIGPIFYRGKLSKIDKNYDLHPIFKEKYDDDKNGKPIIGGMRLQEIKNKNFQKFFTHPMNYVCLLHKPLLIQVLEHYNDKGLKELFGYEDGDIKRDLSLLKINLAHYGSGPQWSKFLRQDRYREANEIIQKPRLGLGIKGRVDNLFQLYALWNYIDWFSIISSMILEFENVYSDVSYTSHDLSYLNLLSEILDNPKIQDRVLYGTDFYVVSNHKTEKQYWIDMQNSLGEEKWQKIANTNPTQFLTSKLPGTIR